jgi:pilus assembly protein CpaF
MQTDSSALFESAIKNFLKPIADHLGDETVTEIMINGPHEIFIERKGKIFRSSAQFPDEHSLRAAVNNIAQSVKRRIDDREPRLDARLPNGYRIHAVIPPCARNGTTVAIRKFSKDKLTFKDLINYGSISVEGAQFLDVCAKLGKNILVSGGTGSGKTTLLGLLANRIPPGERLIVIEDSSELQIKYEHVVFFETRMANEQGEGEVSVRDLLKSSLRLRPDRIVVGEVRGSEALELIQAMNTGHDGSMGTVHANSPDDAMVRLEALAQGSDAKISEKALRHQIASAIHVIIQASRYSDGSRRIAAISEVKGFNSDGTYNVVPLFAIKRLVKLPDGKLKGAMEPSGELPSFMEEIEDNQIPFSRSKFQPNSAA